MRHLLIALLVVAAPAVARADQPKGSLQVTSTAFTANGDIPTQYTCEGNDTPPPLSWSEVPAGTKSVAIVVEDPDAPKGTFTHWIVTNIPPDVRTLAAGTMPPSGTAVALKNDKGKVGYSGPCPPSGKHHYVFKVYALDKSITAPTKAMLERAMEGHILAEGELVGMYEKQHGK
jgi:Raf kinase inhibitor-like YbhB/YbcL family protein